MSTEWRKALEHGKGLFVVVQGWGASGLMAQTVGSVTVPHGLLASRPVMDIPPDDLMAGEDMDFTGASALGASWPAFGSGSAGGNYSWSASREERTWFGCDLPASYDDLPPNMLACGTTTERSVATSPLELIAGTMYYICVRDLGTYATACSDGVTVDDTVPGSGEVTFLHLSGASGASHFQVCTSALAIAWTGFVDVANSTLLGSRPQLTTTIRGYEYAIGTATGAANVVGWTPAGLSTHATVAGLHLTGGQVYQATVRATDHAGNGVWASTTVGVMVDVTAPNGGVVTSVAAGTSSKGGTVADSLTARWSAFQDDESGVVQIQWAVGTAPYAADVASFVDGGDTGASRVDIAAAQGATLFITVKATNGAGLDAVITSAQLTVDLTPPQPSSILDGRAGQTDVEFQATATQVAAHWLRFFEPHSFLTGYWWCVGTAAGECDAKGYEAVGFALAAEAPLAMVPGVAYYTTVRACNTAALCETATSNGVTADITPPVPGLVLDGLAGADVRYQGTDTMLAAHWTGFHDPESGVVDYKWCVGAAPGDCDVLAWTAAYDDEEGVHLLADGDRLRPGMALFVTVQATNGAGVAALASSNGFVVDLSPPKFTLAPHITSGQRQLKYRDMHGKTVALTFPAATQVDDSLIT